MRTKETLQKAVDEAFVLMTGLHNTSAVHSGKFLAPVGVEIGLLACHGFLTGKLHRVRTTLWQQKMTT